MNSIQYLMRLTLELRWESITVVTCMQYGENGEGKPTLGGVAGAPVRSMLLNTSHSH
jgi:hypothetical protein